jgi:ECF transporter S component (folate family)
MAMMVAVGAGLKIVTEIYVLPNFRVFSLSYLPGAMVSLLYGPYAALIYGLVSDTTKFFARPVGIYFPGFAVSEMVMCFIYSVFLYKKRITFLRVALAQLFVTVTVTLGLNIIWLSIIFEEPSAVFYTGIRFITNIAAFPVHVYLLKVSGEYLRRIKKM